MVAPFFFSSTTTSSHPRTSLNHSSLQLAETPTDDISTPLEDHLLA